VAAVDHKLEVQQVQVDGPMLALGVLRVLVVPALLIPEQVVVVVVLAVQVVLEDQV
jgi:hypothetical protein